MEKEKRIVIDVDDLRTEIRDALGEACMAKQKFLKELISEIILEI